MLDTQNTIVIAVVMAPDTDVSVELWTRTGFKGDNGRLILKTLGWHLLWWLRIVPKRRVRDKST